jgi:hypothetical protein
MIRLAAILVFVTGSAFAADLPTPSLTPGKVLTTDAATVCKPGYSQSVRHTSAAVKRGRYAAYGISHHRPGQFEIDHLVSLELGGADDPANLWPQSYLTSPWNAHVKDRLENYLHREVCAGRLPLATAQREIAQDWVAAYRQHLGSP